MLVQRDFVGYMNSSNMFRYAETVTGGFFAGDLMQIWGVSAWGRSFRSNDRGEFRADSAQVVQLPQVLTVCGLSSVDRFIGLCLCLFRLAVSPDLQKSFTITQLLFIITKLVHTHYLFTITQLLFSIIKLSSSFFLPLFLLSILINSAQIPHNTTSIPFLLFYSILFPIFFIYILSSFLLLARPPAAGMPFIY